MLARSDWHDDATASIAVYDRVTRDIDRQGAHASSRTVRQWEVDVERLKVGCLSLADGNEERGRGGYICGTVKGGMFIEGWEFEGRWGKGPGEEEGVAPEDEG